MVPSRMALLIKGHQHEKNLVKFKFRIYNILLFTLYIPIPIPVPVSVTVPVSISVPLCAAAVAMPVLMWPLFVRPALIAVAMLRFFTGIWLFQMFRLAKRITFKYVSLLINTSLRHWRRPLNVYLSIQLLFKTLRRFILSHVYHLI